MVRKTSYHPCSRAVRNYSAAESAGAAERGNGPEPGGTPGRRQGRNDQRDDSGQRGPAGRGTVRRGGAVDVRRPAAAAVRDRRRSPAEEGRRRGRDTRSLGRRGEARLGPAHQRLAVGQADAGHVRVGPPGAGGPHPDGPRAPRGSATHRWTLLDAPVGGVVAQGQLRPHDEGGGRGSRGAGAGDVAGRGAALSRPGAVPGEGRAAVLRAHPERRRTRRRGRGGSGQGHRDRHRRVGRRQVVAGPGRVDSAAEGPRPGRRSQRLRGGGLRAGCAPPDVAAVRSARADGGRPERRPAPRGLGPRGGTARRPPPADRGRPDRGTVLAVFRRRRAGGLPDGARPGRDGTRRRRGDRYDVGRRDDAIGLLSAGAHPSGARAGARTAQQDGLAPPAGGRRRGDHETGPHDRAQARAGPGRPHPQRSRRTHRGVAQPFREQRHRAAAGLAPARHDVGAAPRRTAHHRELPRHRRGAGGPSRPPPSVRGSNSTNAAGCSRGRCSCIWSTSPAPAPT